jgi:hypothetical protein
MSTDGTPEPQKVVRSISQGIWAQRYEEQFHEKAALWREEVLDRVKREPAIESDPESPTNAVDPQLSAQGYIPHTELYGGLWSNVSRTAPPSTYQLTTPRSTKA